MRTGNLRDPTVQAGEAEGSDPRAIALGIERFGLIPFRTPKLSLAIALALVGCRNREDQGRRFARPTVPLEFAGFSRV
jgi:hypothetical protein